MQVLVALLFIILIEVPVNAKIPAVAGRFEIKNIHEYKIKAPQVKAQLSPETESELNKIIDDNLRSCVQEQTTNLDSLSELSKLNCANRDIKNLDGIAALDNLQTLNLRANQIKYVSPLEDLAKLEDINLSKNKIATGIQSLEVISNLKTLNLTDNPRLYCREIRDFYFYDEDNSGFQIIHNCRNSPPVSKLSFADPHLMNKLFILGGHAYSSPINENTKADRLYHLSNKRWNGKRTVLNPLTNLSGIEQLTNLSTLELYGRDNITRQLNLSPLSKVFHLTRLWLDKLPVAQWDWNLPRLTTLSVGESSL